MSEDLANIQDLTCSVIYGSYGVFWLLIIIKLYWFLAAAFQISWSCLIDFLENLEWHSVYLQLAAHIQGNEVIFDFLRPLFMNFILSNMCNDFGDGRVVLDAYLNCIINVLSGSWARRQPSFGVGEDGQPTLSNARNIFSRCRTSQGRVNNKPQDHLPFRGLQCSGSETGPDVFPQVQNRSQHQLQLSLIKQYRPSCIIIPTDQRARQEQIPCNCECKWRMGWRCA